MSLKAIVHDWGMKVAVALAATATIGAIGWMRTNVVLAGDLEPIAEAVKALAEQNKTDQAEWRCSELEEELADFYDRQEAGETLTQRETDRMSRVKERMSVENLNCARFED